MSVHCVALSGGVGGAKLALGLSHVVPADALAVVVNTADDFRHLGLAISPDLDTLLYTLAARVNPDTGWGRSDEHWHCMEALEELGGETWFRLGDRDIATHLVRTARLADGARLTEVTAELRAALGVKTRVLPVSDDAIATQVHTDTGVLPFQEYFVRRRAEPRVQAVEFAGAGDAQPSPEVLAALQDARLQAILVAPSNPWLSIDPLLAVPGFAAALREALVPVVAVSPIVGGRALKGPTAKIMGELGLTQSALAVARHYQPWIDGFILDTVDKDLRPDVEALGITVHCSNTIMQTLDDRIELARTALDFARDCGKAAR
ncbi:MAG: 2-phospho-L-lactate transferase [Chromatiales bacterium]|nr:MAG: 2-phospho-L-lactate transferase [Chromatiales bacterium]